MSKRLDWQRHFEAQQKSGLSIAKYCEKHGIPAGTWYSRRSMQKQKRREFTAVAVKSKVKNARLEIAFEWTDDGQLHFSGSTTEPSRLAHFFGRWQ